MEYNMPISNWHSLIEGTQCELFPMLLGDMAPIRIQPKWVFQKGNMLLLGEDSHLTPARISAAAELFYSQNADGLSLYNFYTYNFAKLYPDLRDFTEPICLKNKQRQYFFCHKVHYEATEDYNFKFGKPFEHLQLSKIGQSVKYVFNFGSELTNTTSNLRFKIKNYQPADELTVFLNGRKIVPNKIENTQFTDREGQAYSVGCWESNSAARNLKLGQNEIKLTLNKNDPARQLPLGIWELEIFISPVR
jgi:hypothetical protein